MRTRTIALWALLVVITRRKVVAYVRHGTRQKRGGGDVMGESALTPPDPDRGYTRTARLASRLLLMRAAWLRFPPRLFFLHSVIKAVPWLRPAVARPQAT